MSEHRIDRGETRGGASKISVSFEFFPPKSEKMEQQLWSSIKRLEPLTPSFVSVTYGAGGSTRERTHSTVSRIIEETSLKPAAHLTCVDASKEAVNEVIRAYWDAGVRHIVGLRGDPATGAGSQYVPHPEGYQTTADLVRAIREIGDFDVSVSAYPERHPESPSWDVELDVLKAKVDAGATRAITQFFFDNEHYLRYVDKVRAAGIFVPILPGIVPVTSFKGISGFAKKTGASVPEWLAHRFEGLDDDPKTRELVAAAVAAEQVMSLADEGVEDFHFYTMNKADLVYAICHILGLREQQEQGEPVAA